MAGVERVKHGTAGIADILPLIQPMMTMMIMMKGRCRPHKGPPHMAVDLCDVGDGDAHCSENLMHSESL